MTAPARNDPCPCGSGRKYKKCCYLKGANGAGDTPDTPIPPPSPAGAVSSELEAALAGRSFSSLEEAQAFANDFMTRRNQQSQPGFQGLSPAQMQALLHRPFDSPDFVTLPAQPAGCETAPVMRLFLLLAEAMNEAALKATAKGNLPQKFCREAALRYWGAEEYADHTRYGGINREDDFRELHTVRVVAGFAGLIRRYKGRFLLSKKCRKYLDAGDTGGLYGELLRAYTREFNWAYLDGYEALPIVQHSFLFTLYLLQRHGATSRKDDFYADCFLEAFPAALDLVEGSVYSGPRDTVKCCYTLRALDRFAHFFGLAAVEALDGDTFLSTQGYRVSALPLLAEVVQFTTGKS